MEKYREYVRQLADTKTNKMFINSDDEHAIEVFINLFRNAQKELRIFAACLCNPVTNDPGYIKEISNFIDRDGKLFILLNDFKKEKALEQNIMRRLAYYQSIGMPIHIKATEAKPYFESDPQRKEIHFTIADNSGYRIETDIEKRTAKVNFNDEYLAQSYSDFFDKIFKDPQSKELNLASIFNLK